MSDVEAKVEEADVPAVAPVVEADATQNHVAIRDFAARFSHQVLRFQKDEVIDPVVGVALRATGAPIKLVEKSVKEIKGKL